MCFGVLVSGVTGTDWGVTFGKRLIATKNEQPDRDFLMANAGKPMAFTAMLSLQKLLGF